MDLQFQYWQALWLLTLLPLLVLLFLGYRWWRKKTIQRIGEVHLVTALFKNHSSLKVTLKFVLVLLAFVCGCIAVANPRKPDPASGENRKGIDILFALDVSNSMLAADVRPNRLQAAKTLMLQLINRFQNDRIALVLFAGTSYLQMPLTFDHNAAQLFVSSANPASISTQGTAIGDALQRSGIAFDKQSERFKSIILITDGETHDEDALKTVKQLSTGGVMINTVGIGSVQGATIMDTATGTQKRDATGNVIISKLNESLLQQIAVATNGRYIHFENVDQTRSELEQQLAQVAKKSLADLSQFNFQTFYGWLALPMLLLLIVELFFPDRKKVKA